MKSSIKVDSHFAVGVDVPKSRQELGTLMISFNIDYNAGLNECVQEWIEQIKLSMFIPKGLLSPQIAHYSMGCNLSPSEFKLLENKDETCHYCD